MDLFLAAPATAPFGLLLDVGLLKITAVGVAVIDLASIRRFAEVLPLIIVLLDPVWYFLIAQIF